MDNTFQKDEEAGEGSGPDKDDDKIIQEALERFELCQQMWSENYNQAASDLRFSIGDQWDASLRRTRENDAGGARPCLTLDKLNQYVRQVINDSRQNTPAIKVRPSKDGDDDVAEVLSGLMRHIEVNSKADQAYDLGIEMAARCGLGFLRILTDYEDDTTLNQDIFIKPISNPFSVYLDPYFKELDASDAEFCFVFDDMPRETFERLWPDKEVVSFEDSGAQKGKWVGEDYIRVAEYFYATYETVTLYQQEDGTVSEKKTKGPSRDVPRRKMHWCKLTSSEVLEHREWPSKYIGVVPVFGRMVNVEGKINIQSMIHPAMDGQRMYNYAASSFVERVSLAPKAKYLAPAASIAGYELEWANAHTSNDPTLPWNHTDARGNPIPTPSYMGGGDVPSGWAAMLQTTEHDIQGALGMYNASIGARSNEISGRAILAKQKESDTSTFDLIDNLSRAIRQAANVILELLPVYYDTRRIVQVVGEDGSYDKAVLDPQAPGHYMEFQDEMNAIRKVFNPYLGKYGVTVTVGPAYSTKRQEASEWMTQFIGSNPSMATALGPLLLKNMDVPGADEAAKILKAMWPPQLQQAMDENNPLPPEAMAKIQGMQQQQLQQALQQGHQQMQQMAIELQQAKQAAANKQIDAQSKMADVQVKQQDIQLRGSEMQMRMAEVEEQKRIDWFAAETARIDAETRRISALHSGLSSDDVVNLARQAVIETLNTPMQEVQNG
jgi:hypothetical protein